MKVLSPNQYSDGKLPVFVFPTCLNFFADDQSSYKQVLTLYNPYDFTLQFKVFCNNPTKYNVVESEGLIKKQCCIDIVIRAYDVVPNAPREDKFRIHLFEYGVDKLLGKKDIVAFTSPTDNSDSPPQSRGGGNIGRKRSSKIKKTDEHFISNKKHEVLVERTLPNLPVIFTTLTCLIALMLPSVGDKPTATTASIPEYLHLSLNQKLIAAYILGLVTMSVLRTT